MTCPIIRDAVAYDRVRTMSSRLATWFRYSLPGAWVALIFASLSFTPSLLPRGALFQAVVAGPSGAIGYPLGVVGAWGGASSPTAGRGHLSPARGTSSPSPQPSSLVVSIILRQRWQGQIRELMGVPDEGGVLGSC